MNPNHDGKTGEFSSGGGSAVPADRMSRFVHNAHDEARHNWMGRGNLRQASQGEAHVRQDQVSSTAHEHQRVPTFGKRH